MNLVLARVDNRLIHGQVLQTWVPETSTDIIVVTDNNVAADPLRQSIMEAALPEEVDCIFVTVEGLNDKLAELEEGGENVLLLFCTLEDVKCATGFGVKLKCLNIGNIHYEDGKTRVSPGVCLGIDDVAILRELALEMEIEIRATPSDEPLHYPSFLSGEEIKAKSLFKRMIDKITHIGRSSDARNVRP